MIVDLPEEVLVHIFEYLDYKSLQWIAVQVCKEWLSIIRNDCKLSGELRIKQFKHEDLPNIKGSLISESFLHLHKSQKGSKFLSTIHLKRKYSRE